MIIEIFKYTYLLLINYDCIFLKIVILHKSCLVLVMIKVTAFLNKKPFFTVNYLVDNFLKKFDVLIIQISYD